MRRREADKPLNALGKSTFASTNSALGWIGIAASPFCSFYSSYLQQNTPKTKVSHLAQQNRILKKLRHLGTSISYPRRTDKESYWLTVLALADATKACEYGQLRALVGLLVGDMKLDAI